MSGPAPEPGPQPGLEPVDPARHAGLLHAWVTHPRSRFWMMQDATVADVDAAYAAIAADPHHDAWLGRVGGRPLFLAETYDPARAEQPGLGGLPDLEPGDLGMHVLVAPPDPDEPRVPGLTRRVLAAVLRHCFADPATRRVVVEPDVRNEPIAVLNAAAGFRVVREVDLPGKTAALSVCRRADFLTSPLGGLR